MATKLTNQGKRVFYIEEKQQPVLYATRKELLISLNDALDNKLLQKTLECCKCLKYLLSAPNESPPINSIIQFKPYLVPKLIKALCFNNAEKYGLAYEIVCIFTNLLAGNKKQTSYLIECNVLEALMHIFLNTQDTLLQKQLLWALTNLATDCIKVLNQNEMLPKVLSMYDNAPELAVWFFATVCDSLSLVEIRSVLPCLKNAFTLPNFQLRIDICYAIRRLCIDTTTNNEKIQAVIDSGILSVFTSSILDTSQDIQVLSAIWGCIGHIASGNARQTTSTLSTLSIMKDFLVHRKECIREQTCFALSNIALGSEIQLQDIINADLIPVVVKLLQEDDSCIVQINAAWTLMNATHSASADQIEYLVTKNIIPAFGDVLELFTDMEDEEMICVTLSGLKHILKKASVPKRKCYVDALKACGAFEMLELLADHKSHTVHHRTRKLLVQFCLPETSKEIQKKRLLCSHSHIAKSPLHSHHHKTDVFITQ